MMTKPIKRKLLKAKISLNHTIQKILEINRKRNVLSDLQNPPKMDVDLSQELKVLNKLAEHQAHLVKRYEYQLSSVRG